MDTLGDPSHYMPDEAKLAEIRGHIDEYNAERPSIQQRSMIQAAVYMVGYTIVAGFILVFTFHADEKHKVFGFVAAILAFGGFKLWEYAWQPARDHQLVLRYRLFPVILGFIDKVQYSNGYAPGFLEDIKRMKLLEFTSSENDDLVSGTHDGLGFEMVEAKLIRGSGKSKTTVFKGLIFRFMLDKEFPGTLVAARRGNWLQEYLHQLFGRHDDTVATGDWEIDQTHEIHTDNYAAARPLAEGPLASALRYFKREWWAGEVRIALRGGECFLLLPADRDYFALPGIGEDVDYLSHVQPMIRDMVVLLAVAHLIKKLGAHEENVAEAPEQVTSSQAASS